MPSNYAHYRFGKEIQKKLPESIRNEVQRYPELFMIGQHGPDILFFYNAFKSNPVVQEGHEMHRRRAADFFRPSIDVLKTLDEDHGERAYLYGFVCHFMLDSCAHWYVEDKIRTSGVCHTAIEAEFDRILMEMDGLDPVSYVPTDHISATEENAHVIAKFLPGISDQMALKSLKDMRFYGRILVCPGFLKRTVILTGMKILGMSGGAGGMVIKPEANPKCADSNEKLLRLFDAAQGEAVRYLKDVEMCIQTGSPLPERFHRTFGPDAVSREEYKNLV